MSELVGVGQPEGCAMAHDVINKLSIIIGHCDLLREQVEAAGKPNARIVTSVETIRRVASGVVGGLREHGCDAGPIHRTMMLCEAVEETMGRKAPVGVAQAIEFKPANPCNQSQR